MDINAENEYNNNKKLPKLNSLVLKKLKNKRIKK
jgi:hypothetical protein